MYHSITFGNKNTWTDWHLVASSRPVINPPKPKVQYVDIPGADGSIDLTESLAGRPVFNDREGSIEFIVLNDLDIDGYQYNWAALYSEIMSYLHGKHMKMVLEDDPLYYYEGRFSVNSWKSDANHSTIAIDYRVSPYKYLITNDFGTTDLEYGLLAYDSQTDPPSIVESQTDCVLCLAEAKAYSAGDSIRVDNPYLFDVAMYGGTLEALTAKGVVQSSRMSGNHYSFSDSGFYRINIYTMARWSSTPIPQADIPKYAQAVHYYTGGVL